MTQSMDPTIWSKHPHFFGILGWFAFLETVELQSYLQIVSCNKEVVYSCRLMSQNQQKSDIRKSPPQLLEDQPSSNSSEAGCRWSMTRLQILGKETSVLFRNRILGAGVYSCCSKLQLVPHQWIAGMPCNTPPKDLHVHDQTANSRQ